MHNPIVIRRANIRGKRLEQKPQELSTEETAVALSDLPQNAPMQPLDPAPATEKVVPHKPRKRKPYGLAIAAAMLAITPILYAFGVNVLGLVLVGRIELILLFLMPLLAIPLSNIGGILLYLTARAANYMRKPVALVSLELLVLQIGTFMIYRDGLADEFLAQNMQHPLLTISLICLILLCMILLCVFSVLMLVHLLPKRHTKDAKA